MERRYAELRQDGRRLTGTAIRYGEIAELPFGFERFEPGAFQPIGDAILNRQHDRGRPLARTGGGGLVLHDDASALRIEAALPQTRESEDTLSLVKAGVLRGLSIEFNATDEQQDGNVRVIRRARLSGVAVVDSGAYPGSTVEARRRRSSSGRLRASIPYRKRLECRCHKNAGTCGSVQFSRGSFAEAAADDDLILFSKDYGGPIASKRRGTLRVRETNEGLEVDADLPDTTAGADLIGASASVPLLVRPLMDIDASDFTEAGDLATYSKVSVRALLVGATDAAEGWPDAEIEGPARPPRRRARTWL